MAITHDIVTDLRRYQVVTDLHLSFLVLAWGRVTDLRPVGRRSPASWRSQTYRIA